MEDLGKMIARKRVFIEDMVWYKEPSHYDSDIQAYVNAPKQGYLLASYLFGGQLRFIVLYGDINSCVVRQVKEVFANELECYKSIIEERKAKVNG